jgi:hypothetical protein
MMLPMEPRRLTLRGRVLTLIVAMVVTLIATAAAQAATPSLLAGEQVDGHGSALNAVSCASASYCVTGGLDLIVQDHGVRSDLTTQLSTDTNEITAISCAPGTTTCAVLDDSGGAYLLQGETLGTRTQVSSPNAFDDVSCPTSAFCMAVDDLGEIYTFDGSSWSPTVGIGDMTARSGRDVSCTSATFCVIAVPTSGAEQASVYNGNSYTAGTPMDASGGVSGLSCTSTTFCVATDSHDNALLFDGMTWTTSAAPLISGGATGDDFDVSCVTGFCLASSSETGDTFTSADGLTWTAGTNIKLANDGVGGGGPTSCPTSTTCVIVDLSGTGYTYAVPDTPSTPPVLSGSPTAGATLTLTPGTVASPDVSVIDTLQRCLAGCATLSGTSYTTSAADAGATFTDSETTGIGLDIEGPASSNTIGPIIVPVAVGGGTAPGTGGGGSTGTGRTTTKGAAATVGAITVKGTAAHVTVSCPATSTGGCHIAVVLTVIKTTRGKKAVAASARPGKTTRRTVTVGASAATIGAGSHRQITVALNGTGRKLLRSSHRLTAHVSVSQSGTQLAARTVHFAATRGKGRKTKQKRR